MNHQTLPSQLHRLVTRIKPLTTMSMMLFACSTSSSPENDLQVPAHDAALTSTDAAPEYNGAADEFIASASAAVCDGLFRCCDDGSLESFFAPYLSTDLLVEFHHRLPPNANLAAEECPALLEEISEITPFGDWVEAVRTGRVTFHAEQVEECANTLATAACGPDVAAALFDSTCFGFSPPADGRQRSFFSRASTAAVECSPIRDGVGAVFYGNCNPAESFCCYIDESNPALGCTFPFNGDGVPRTGTCMPVGAVSDSCSAAPPLSLCATGNTCDFDSSTCTSPSNDILEVGAECMDGSFNLLGECQASFCDVFGSKQCTEAKLNGEACISGVECAGGACSESLCQTSVFCLGQNG